MRTLSILFAAIFFTVHGIQAQRAEQVEPAGDHGIREKLYVHLDRPNYLAGEVLWFKAYCVDATTHRPLGLSKVCYVDVLDKDDRFVLQAKIGMKDAVGRGSFYLPLTLMSGIYKLRAYTSWMKNFGPGDFFEQPLTIINTLKDLPKPPVAPTDSAGPPSGDTLVFFPEGGNLVTGLSSTVAFQAIDANGEGLDGQGVVTDEKGDTITVFKTERFGMGRFVLTPEDGRRYRAHVVFADRSSGTEDLPMVFTGGYVMHVEGTGDGGKGIRVLVHAKGAASATSSPDVYLMTRSGASVLRVFKSSLINDSAVFMIPGDSLGEGVTRLTLFSGSQRPFCERLVFKSPADPMSIALGADKEQYGTRGKVNLTVSLPAEKGETASQTSLSLSVYRVDSLHFKGEMNMYSYLWLGSELRGRIESPEYYLTARNAEAAHDADNLMLTHGWRRFRWEDQGSESKPFLFPPEYAGHIIMGRLTDTRTGLPLAGRLATLSVPGIDYRFRVAITDSMGRMVFDIKDFYGQQGIVIHTGTIVDSPCKVDILTPFSEQFGGDKSPAFALSPQDKQSLLNRHLDMQIQNIYATDSIQRFRAPVVDTLHFFNTPDHTYMLDDYTRFTTMEEVLREYVREINVNRPHGKNHLLMLDEPDREFFDDNNTLVLLDGVQVPDDKIFDEDPLKVRRLDVVSRRYFIGPAFYSGIASFSTYKGDYTGFELDRHSTLLDYDCLQWQREFYAPDYETKEQRAARLPDFRNLLYWTPDILLQGSEKRELNFYTSDVPGLYRAVVQGLSADGRAAYQELRFEVK